MEQAPKKNSVPWLSAMEALTGVSLDDIIDSLPKGSTPNRYNPHQGKREMERRAKKMKGGA